jgi:hypothetical protein
MAVEMRPVYSSHIDQIGHDPQTGDLYVTWKPYKDKPTKTSTYAGVPAEEAFRVMNAPSVAKAVDKDIKPFYEHRYA